MYDDEWMKEVYGKEMASTPTDVSTGAQRDTLWDNPNTCLRLNLLLDTDENPLTVYTRMEFFRLMVARGVYSEYPHVA